MNDQAILLARALGKLNEAKERIKILSQKESIAIIGMSCRFPGGADTPQKFWELLEQAFDSSIEVPKTRWDIDTYYDPDPEAKGKIISRKSSFLTTPIDEFDARFFNISPREAEFLDPQQRLLLEVTWEALEEAGIVPTSLEDTQTGVFVGISSKDYSDLLQKYLPTEEIDAYYATGNAASAASGRISYTLGLKGPCLAIDTACSSSLVALHEACLSLRNGESDLAIAGGVNILLSPDLSVDFSQAHMLAADGYCKTFDKDADGYVRGEGCGVIILKRLSDAQRDNDRILAVIKGSAVNQDGASGGLTVPNGPSQEAVIRQALKQAKLHSQDIDYIEAHGTGTHLGDPIEFNALAKVFKGREKALTIGTVKTNIGHLEAAAGIAGVIKTVLALQHEKIPQHLHFKEINPSIDLSIIPAQIPLQALEWKKETGKIRRAGVSSFGFSGTNAHIILEEATLQDANMVRQPLPKTIFNRQRYWVKALYDKQLKPYEWKKTLPILADRDIATSDLTWVIIDDEKGIGESLNTLLKKQGAKTQIYQRTLSWEVIKSDIMQDPHAGLIYFSQDDQDLDYENLKEMDAPLWIIFPQTFGVKEGTVDRDSLPLDKLNHAHLIGVPQEFSAKPQIAKAIYAELCQEQPARYVIIGKTRLVLIENVFKSTKVVAVKNELIETLPTSHEALHSFILEHVREKVLSVLGIPYSTTQDETGFFEMGIDSLMAVELNKTLSRIFPTVNLSSTATFDNPTITKLAAVIEAEITGVKPQIIPSVFTPNEPIAIIGMSCRFPAGANSPEMFWKFLQQGFEGGVDIPKSRWEMDDYPKMYVNRAGLLNIPIDLFDAEFFNISPREAEYMDPQQRIVLEETWLALENARVTPSMLKESNTGVFLGICSHDYLDLLDTAFAGAEGYVTTGNTASIAAGRIAYTFGFRGPCVSIDTACSSSLVSVHLACQSLRDGESDMAVAGGVNIILSPMFMESLCELHMLSPEGYCKTFDKNADGYLRGEGCGMIVLKRLSDAKRDNDCILAVIKGSAMNQDGASSGLTVPNGNAQEAVIRKALQQANLNPTDIDYIEVHGTATSLGDPIEVNALAQVFKNHERPLTLGTVKTNVGHLEGAAGIVGIIKTILALQHEEIPCHLHFQELNPAINLDSIPAQIPLEPLLWKKESDRIRRAGISSFGFSGTNAHIILEEAPDTEQIIMPAAIQEQLNNRDHLLIISAKTEAALIEQIGNYITYLKTTTDAIYDICYSSQITRTRFEKTIGVMGKTREEILTHLESKNHVPDTEINKHMYADNEEIKPYLKKVDLPTYPFQREHYWAAALTHPTKKAVFGEEVHALLGIRLPRSATHDEIVFEKTLNLTEDTLVYLGEHQVFNHIIFPGAGYVELMLAAMKANTTSEALLYGLELSHVSIELPLSLDKEMIFSLQTILTFDINGIVHISIYSRAQVEDEVFSPWQLHAQGEGRPRSEQISFLNEVSLEKIKAECTESINIEDFYKWLSAHGLQYGAAFQTLKEIYRGQNAILAKVGLGATSHADYILYPPLLDGALQALSLITSRAETTTNIYLPIGFDRITLYHDIPPVFYVYMQANQSLLPVKDILNVDFILLNEDGNILAKIEGFKSKRTSRGVIENLILNKKPIESWCYVTQWQPYTLATEISVETVAIVYDARIKSESQVNQQVTDNILTFLQTQINQNTSNSHIVIITEQAYSLQNEPINLNQGMLNGLIKTAILEHPELHIRQLDVSTGENITPLLSLLAKDTSDESLFAYRNQQWYVERVVKLAQADKVDHRLSIPAGPYRLIKSESGLIDDLHLVEELSALVPGDDEVLIAPQAVGLNFRDVLNAMNLYPGDPGPLGGDCAGVIKAVGKNVQEFIEGDEVLGVVFGSLASQALTHCALIVKKPAFLSFNQGATIPTVFMTAYYGLITLAKMQAGETVLIHAGAGGVGLAAIQLAQYLKTRIIATAGSDEKRKYLHSLGIEHVFDSRSLNYQTEILHVTHGRGVDVVLNSLTGPGFIEATLNCCNKGARFIEIGKRDIWNAEQIKAKRADITSYIIALDTILLNQPQIAQQLLQNIMRLLTNMEISTIPETHFPLTQAIEAFKYFQQAKQIGKVVITMPSAEIIFQDNASYLITGGLGGLGLQVAQYLSAHHAKRIILVGRNFPNEKARNVIQELASKGITIIVKQVDVSQKIAVNDLIQSLQNKRYPLKGIFHLAGVIDDAPLDKQTSTSFAKVFASKVWGAKYLHEATQTLNLDYFVLFSSIASLIGSPGQSNYASANSFLDALTVSRYQQGLNSISINWGPWRDVGMASDLVKMHERQGMKPLKVDEGLLVLDYILKQNRVLMGVINADWKKVSEFMPNSPSWLADILKQKSTSAFKQQLQALSPAERETVLKDAITREVRIVLGFPNHQSIDAMKGFFEMGMDSLIALELKNRLQRLIGVSLSNTVVFDYPSLDTLIPYISSLLKITALPTVKPQIQYLSQDEPIAIIGMDCQFPGGANSAEDFWKLLDEGFDSSIEVPKSRWDIDAYYDPDPEAKGKMVSRKSSFMMTPIDEFDADFFGITPREANMLDPQQRLLLEMTWKALETAGINPQTLKGTLTGVFIGLSSHDYEDLLTLSLSTEAIDAYMGTGNAASTATGRISFMLGLQGPNMAIDTACSSSLVALHQASQSLRLGECDLAIAGGVNVLLSPMVSIDFSQAHMLAADGHCKTFDKSADGYVRGEGCGIVILKRLSDAKRDNDRILAIVKGSAVNQDGTSGGLTVPNGPAQEAVIKRALVQARLTAIDIDYIEAHGTGTSLGDPIEYNALAQVFKGRETPLIIGTVKTNIGHLEAAAGIAGIIKTILSLQHEKISRHLHFKEINPAIDLNLIPAKIPLQSIEWKKQAGKIRRAGISSFGFSGTNAHIILEEAPDTEQIIMPAAIQEQLNNRDHLLIISAKTEAALIEQIKNYITYLKTTTDAVYDICYSSQITRTRFAKAIAVMGKTREEILTHLESKNHVPDTEINKHMYADNEEIKPYLKKVALPTYPFQREHYWAAALTHPTKKAVFGEEVHALLGIRLPRSATHDEIFFEKTLNLTEDTLVYLGEHQVFNHIIFPGAGYVELMLAAMKANTTSEALLYGLELSHVSIELPLSLDKEMIFSLQTILTFDIDGIVHISIYSRAQVEDEVFSPWQLHAQGEGRPRSEQISLLNEVSLEKIKAECTESINIEDFYKWLSVHGLQYGAAFQTLKEIYRGPNAILAKVGLDATSHADYILYPPLLDGALQALSLITSSAETTTNIYLPIGFDRITLYHDIPPVFYVYMQANQSLLPVKDILNVDFILLNDDGSILAKIEGFKSKRTSRGVIENLILNKKPIESWCYVAQWQPYTLATEISVETVAIVYDARIKSESQVNQQVTDNILTFLQTQINQNTSNSHIVIITEQAYSLQNEPINLNQGMLNGLIKTAILEHPELHIRQLDVSTGENITPLLSLLAKDTSDESLFAYRNQQWYVERVVKLAQANKVDHRLSIPAGPYRLIKSESGLIDDLHLVEELSALVPGDDEVLIVPQAVGLNFRDVLNAMNLYPGDPGPLGGDCAGVIKAVGKNINQYHIGDEVVGLALGSLSSQALTHENLITLKPKMLQFTEAATIPTIFMTAYLALVKIAKLTADETVLIHAGTGGVGLAAVQIATYCKAKIIATAGSEKKREYLHSLGVEHVFDSRSLSFKDDILRVTNNNGVNVILNSLSGKGFIAATLECAASNARFIEIGKRDIWSTEAVKAKRDDILYYILALDQLSIDNPAEIQILLQAVMQLFEKQILKPIPQTIFTLSQTVSAFKYLQHAKQIGKVVITLPPAEIVFKDNTSYLITGGLGGVGLEVAKYLAKNGVKHLILTSRHATTEAVMTDIEKIRAQGVEVLIFLCDVSVSNDINALIKNISTQDYPLRGIFHLAGILEDAPLDKQTKTSFANVFAPKALGAWNLHEATKVLPLDYFVLFSSMASLNGSPAQSNYATANSFLDSLAVYRQQLGLNGTSIDWGPWREVGMAKDLVRRHERQGLDPLGTENALSALSFALKQMLPQIGIIKADWKKITESQGIKPSWLASLAGQIKESDFIKTLQMAPLEQREILLKQAIINEVKNVIGQTQKLDGDKGFFDMGMDSLMALELKNHLQVLLGVSLPNTLAFDYPNLDNLVLYLSHLLKLSSLPAVKEKIQYLSQQEPIAIIGMSCRFPGGANSVEEFWQLLEQGFDSSIEIPKSRWDVDEYYDPDPEAKGKIISSKSSFLTVPIDEFDADFFGISPREAEMLDPQQRLLLEVSWEAFEDAGIAPDSFKDTLTGVFVGISSHDYGDLLAKTLSKEQIDAYLATGNVASTATGRISYTLGLKGPSIALDTACSSSLVSLHEACLSLRNGDCDLALAGGVNMLLSPDVSIDFSQAHMLAPDGHCKTFDKSADGYVRGEGCGIVVLKRLTDAQRDNNKILVVIKSSAVNQDGASGGLTVPNGPAQETVIRRALAQAQLAPKDIDYIEAHGTGTALGDPIEVNALSEIFKGRDNPLIIGTVKTNIGHLEAAAGIAGVIKTILALQHEKIPRHLHFHELNPVINLDSIPAQIPLNSMEWKKEADQLRYAGISSFGFSGTNAHIILAEAPIMQVIDVPANIQEKLNNQEHLLIISSKTDIGLMQQIAQYIEYLRSTKEPIYDICYSSQITRAHFEKSITIVGKTLEDLIINLESKNYKNTNASEAYFYTAEILPYLKKVSLPKYIFQRKKYWIKAIVEEKKPSPEVHPYNIAWQPLSYELSPLTNETLGKKWLIIGGASTNYRDTLAKFLLEAGFQKSLFMNTDENLLLEKINNQDCFGIIYFAEDYTCAKHLQSAAEICSAHVLPLYVITELLYQVHEQDNVALNNTPLNGVIAQCRHDYRGSTITQIDTLFQHATAEMTKSLGTYLINVKNIDVVAMHGDQLYQGLLKESSVKNVLPYAQHYKLTFTESGLLSDLHFKALQLETLNAHDVLIQIKATGVNLRDVLTVLHLYQGLQGEVGLECSGRVLAVGAAVTRVAVGDDVFGITPGAFADNVIANEAMLVKKPSILSYIEAAALPIVYTTAYAGLIMFAQLKAGEKILIHAAAGGVGLAAIQVAKWIGAEIYATAGNDEKRIYLRSLGITHIYNSRNLDFREELLRDTQGAGVDVVLNSLTGEGYIEASLACTAKYGRFVEIGRLNIWPSSAMKAIRPDINYQIMQLDDEMVQHPEKIAASLEWLITHFESRELQSLPYKIFSITEIKEAFAYLEQAKNIGKVIVEMPQTFLHIEDSCCVVGNTRLSRRFMKWLSKNSIQNIKHFDLNNDTIKDCSRWLHEKTPNHIFYFFSEDIDISTQQQFLNAIGEVSTYQVTLFSGLAGFLGDNAAAPIQTYLNACMSTQNKSRHLQTLIVNEKENIGFDMLWKYEASVPLVFLANIDLAKTRAPESSWLRSLELFTDKNRGLVDPALMSESDIEQFIKENLAMVLGFASLDELDTRKGFFELGLDSLMAVELGKTLEQQLGVKLSSTSLFDYPNIATLTEYIVQQTHGGKSTKESKLRSTEFDKLTDTEIMQAIDELYDKKQGDSHD